MSAIANARTHRCERRARADLEAMVEPSGVGVVVLDVKSCQAVPVNREAKRLAKGLLPPGHPLGQFLEVVRFHLAGWRDVSFGECLLAPRLSSGETVRGDEVVLSIPDGRSVRTLLNATHTALQTKAFALLGVDRDRIVSSTVAG